MTLKDLSTLTATEYKDFLNSFDTVLTDCDGVLWIGNNTLKGSTEIMNKFKAMGKKVFYVTNNSTKTRTEYLEKFKQLGFNASKEEIVSTSYLAASYLKAMNFNKKVYIIGSTGISQELDEVGIKHTEVGPDPLNTSLPELLDNLKLEPDIGAVIVGLDEHFSLPKMIKAATYLERPGTHFIATNADERCPLGDDRIIMPGTGTYVAAVRTVAQRPPIIMGKPEAYIREHLVNIHKVDPSRTIMIGDNCKTDILLGTRCGFKTLMVETGVSKVDEVKSYINSTDKDLKGCVPDFYTHEIGDMLPHVQAL